MSPSRHLLSQIQCEFSAVLIIAVLCTPQTIPGAVCMFLRPQHTGVHPGG